MPATTGLRGRKRAGPEIEVERRGQRRGAAGVGAGELARRSAAHQRPQVAWKSNSVPSLSNTSPRIGVALAPLPPSLGSGRAMSRTPTRPAPTSRHFATFSTRWRDNDVYGHMNNAVFYEYVDTLVNGWLIAQRRAVVPDGPVICLVVETGCVFFDSLGFPEPGRGRAAGRPASARARSPTAIGLFRPGAATRRRPARFVHVCVDRASRRPSPIPDALRAALAALSPQVQSGA